MKMLDFANYVVYTPFNQQFAYSASEDAIF